MYTSHSAERLSTMQFKRKREEAELGMTLEDICCPITKTIMRDPVVASDGYTYERFALRELFLEDDAVSPVTGEPLDARCALIPNHLITAFITSWTKAHPDQPEPPPKVSSDLFRYICKKVIAEIESSEDWKVRMRGDTPIAVMGMIVRYLDGCTDTDDLFFGHETLVTLITTGTACLPEALSTGVAECVAAAVESINHKEIKTRATNTLAALAPHLRGEDRERADTLLKRAYKDVIGCAPDMLSMMFFHNSHSNYWWHVICTEAGPDVFESTVKELLHIMSEELVHAFEDMIISNLPTHKTRTVQALALSVQRPFDRSSAMAARVAPLIQVATLDDDNELKQLALEVLNKMIDG